MRGPVKHPSPRLVAVHESGHAFASWLLCDYEHMGGLSIKPTGRTAGRWRGGAGLPVAVLKGFGPCAVRDGQIIREATRCLAGPLAMKRAITKAAIANPSKCDIVGRIVGGQFVVDCGGALDVQRAMEFASIGRTPLQAIDFLRRVSRMVDNILARDDVWIAVSVLAQELERRKYLRFSQVYSTLDNAWMNKKDGVRALEQLGKKLYYALCPESREAEAMERKKK